MIFDRKNSLDDKWKWFFAGKYGLFIHWGPYSAYGRGEQVLFREHLNQTEYEQKACQWNPSGFDAEHWADVAKRAGFQYACLTTRHHDGYCLWDTKYTDYSSTKQAPKRDFVKEYVEAFRKAGLKIGLYYSWLDWRVPAYYLGPEKDPEGWKSMKKYLYHQIEELMTGYGKIDYFFFDGVWPRNGRDLGAEEVVRMMRGYQPDIMINNRLGYDAENTEKKNTDGGIGAGGGDYLGDFSTPEHEIIASGRMWESCQVSTWRLWGYTKGERWRSSDYLLDMLCECVEKGGNMILNVGPDKDGKFPREFEKRVLEIGKWLEIHGEAIFDIDGSDLTEFITRGRQTIKGNNLYLIIRFWDGEEQMRLADIVSKVKQVTLLTTGKKLPFEQKDEVLYIGDLPKERPTELFPVIKIEFDEFPKTNQWGRERLWGGNELRCVEWAKKRGTTVYVGK